MRNFKYFFIPILCGGIVTAGYANIESEHDLGLANKAKIAMMLKKGVHSANIKTHASKGVLQIAGYVNNKSEYAEVLRGIHDSVDCNTNKIINNIKVYAAKNDDPSEDKQLAQHVIVHLKEAKFPTKGVSVQVKARHVMLSGFVDKHTNINKATTLAKKVPGIEQVDNYLLYKQ